jgi:molecular chaperone HtpG
LVERGGPFAITIALDPEAKTLTISDNGVGMDREDLTQGLGTIARSGTKAFLDKLAADEASKEASALIGQFGIGFYSAFMVADEVVVQTRRAGSDAAWRWSSDGKGSFTIAPLALEAPCRSTSSTGRAPSRAGSATARPSGQSRNPTSRRKNTPSSIAACRVSSTSQR